MDNIRVLYLTGIPAPYRVSLFNCMGKMVRLTVVFLSEYQSERNSKWQSVKPQCFNAVFLNKGALNGKKIDFSMVDYLKKHASEYDLIVVHGTSFIASIFAISWMKTHKVRYGIEADGAIIPKKESKVKQLIKRYCIRGASFFLSSGKMTTQYFKHYGADTSKCYLYPFTSLSEEDILNAIKLTHTDKQQIRKEIGIREEKVVITVGRFSYDNGYGKGYDILHNIAEKTDGKIGFFFIGDNPTEEFVRWKESKGLTNVHFVGYKDKNELYRYYAAADVFVLLSRADAWGIAIYEAMMFSLPIISSDKCVGGIELVEDGVNGYIVGLDNVDGIQTQISYLLYDNNRLEAYGKSSLKRIVKYTIENSTEEHNKELCNVLGRILDIKKKLARNKLGLSMEKDIVLFVGQFIYRKGIDILLKASEKLDHEKVSVLIVGGNPTSEYLDILKKWKIKSVEFVGFLNHNELSQYYIASDIFVFPTREDIWGLVINEALLYCLPTITTDKCVAGIELLPNSSIVPANDYELLSQKIKSFLSVKSHYDWVLYCLNKSQTYTIENSALIHYKIFRGQL